MKIFLFFICLTLFSETVVLKNGQTVQGKVLGHDSESITISVDGETKTIPKSNVHKVIFSSNSVELTKIVKEKKHSSKIKKEKEETTAKTNDEDDLTSDDDNDEKKDIYQKLIILQQTQEKYEKKVKRLREKIYKLKKKLSKRKSET